MNNLPLNLQIEFAKSKFREALSQCIMEYGLPAYMMEGIVLDILLEVKRIFFKLICLEKYPFLLGKYSFITMRGELKAEKKKKKSI